VADQLVGGREFATEADARGYMRVLWELFCDCGMDERWSLFTVGRLVWLHERTDDEQLAYLDIRYNIGRRGRGQFDSEELARGP
jgi:hypothetical protein